MWDNPVLWREMCTWAYGKKVLIIRLAYLVFALLASGGLYYAIASGAILAASDGATVIPRRLVRWLPFFW